MATTITPTNNKPPSSPLKPLKSAILLHTLPSNKNHTHSITNDQSNHIKHKSTTGKRRLSSVEGLNETEQIKLMEILVITLTLIPTIIIVIIFVFQGNNQQPQCESSAESSIDWSHVDQLLLSV